MLLTPGAKNVGKLSAKANDRISEQTLNTFYSSFRRDGSYGGFWGRPFWLFNKDLGCYTLIPFALGWSSPYGGSYSRFFYSGYGYPYARTPGSRRVDPDFGGNPRGGPIGSGSAGPRPPSSSGRAGSDSPMRVVAGRRCQAAEQAAGLGRSSNQPTPQPY